MLLLVRTQAAVISKQGRSRSVRGRENKNLPRMQVWRRPVRVPFHAQAHLGCYFQNAVSGTCYDVTMLRPTLNVSRSASSSRDRGHGLDQRRCSEWHAVTMLRCYDLLWMSLDQHQETDKKPAQTRPQFFVENMSFHSLRLQCHTCMQ
jgi:hypothetical protein